MARLHRIVFTSGPGSGKSEGAKEIRHRLHTREFPAHIIPEPATHIFHPAGFDLDLSHHTEEARYAVQRALFRAYLAMMWEIERTALNCFSESAHVTSDFYRESWLSERVAVVQ